MLKKSHRGLAVAIAPLLFIKVNNVEASNFEIINLIINNYNLMVTEISKISFFLPLYLIVYFYGSTFPDIDHNFKYFYKKEDWNKRYLYHRQTTHSILLLIIMFIYSLLYGYNVFGIYTYLITALSLGMFAHILGDMITGSVPWFFYAPYYRKFSRIGITIFLPKIIHPVFTDKFPKYINKHYLKIFVPMFIFSSFILGQYLQIINIEKIVLN